MQSDYLYEMWLERAVFKSEGADGETLMTEQLVQGKEATKILKKWREHLRIEHQLPGECKLMRELTWVIGEAIDGHVVLGLPKPKEEAP